MQHNKSILPIREKAEDHADYGSADSGAVFGAFAARADTGRRERADDACPIRRRGRATHTRHAATRGRQRRCNRVVLRRLPCHRGSPQMIALQIETAVPCIALLK
jgi:hypothetical protein